MKPIYDLYCEMIEEKGDEKLDQHWSMVFAGKIEKEFIKEIDERIKNLVKRMNRMKKVKDRHSIDSLNVRENELLLLKRKLEGEA